MTCFKDIVPKAYLEFQDVFSKEAFYELPNQKQWDHAIKLIPDASNFSTKVYSVMTSLFTPTGKVVQIMSDHAGFFL